MITIDVRWINSSGIGTYIRNVVPGIIEGLPNEQFSLIGNPCEIEGGGLQASDRIHLISAESKMYSIGEQFEMPRLIPKNTRLYFSPHYPIPLLYKGRMLVTIHDVFHLAMPKMTGGIHKLLYAKFMFSRVVQKASAIITDSLFTKAEIDKYVTGRLTDIYPIYLGVDPSWFLNETSEPIYSKPYLVFVGNIKPNKNLISLIQAFILVKEKIPHDLIIVGRKSGFITGDAQVSELAKQHADRIIFTDLLPDEQLKRYIKGATALVFPSLYEGFGLPPLEAMASGCPVLCSDRASLPEVCGDAALFCNPDSIEDLSEKIQLIALNPELQNELKVKGIAQAKKFTWEKTIEQTLRVIRGLLAE